MRRLMKISDEGGKIEMTQLAEGEHVSRTMISSDDAFILDDGATVFVWIGLKASSTERRKAMTFGQQYLNDFNLPSDRCIVKMMEGGENETFEQAFEVGVMSEARPGDPGVKFSGDINKIRGLQVTKEAALSTQATYKGAGGPGVAVDFDELYRQPCADPAEWRGRSKPESSYSAEMQEKSLGAYNAKSGWVASLTKEQREERQNKIVALEKKYVEMGKDGGAVHLGGSDILTSAGTEGSLQACENFDANTDAEGLRNAMKGMGARKQPIIDILTNKSLGQRLEIRQAYEEHVKRDLFKDIDSEWQLNGNLARVLKVLIRNPYERDANFLYKAMRALRPDVTLIVEILCTQEASEVAKVAEAYAMVSKSTLVEDLNKEFGGMTKKYTKELLVALASGKRPPAGPIDPALVKADAEKLYQAGEKKGMMKSTDNLAFVEVLSERSYGHINALVEAYPKASKKKTSLLKAVTKNNSGAIKGALRAIVGVAKDPTAYYTERLHKALNGNLVGTHSTSLIRILVARAEVDLMTIEALYASEHGKALADELSKESGFHKLLRNIVMGNKTVWTDMDGEAEA